MSDSKSLKIMRTRPNVKAYFFKNNFYYCISSQRVEVITVFYGASLYNFDIFESGKLAPFSK